MHTMTNSKYCNRKMIKRSSTKKVNNPTANPLATLSQLNFLTKFTRHTELHKPKPRECSMVPYGLDRDTEDQSTKFGSISLWKVISEGVQSLTHPAPLCMTTNFDSPWN